MKTNSMDSSIYYRTLGYDPDTVAESGGQWLILADIMACLKGCTSIYLPLSCPAVEKACELQGIEINSFGKQADAVYWGTPTIVDNKVLFPECLDIPELADTWNKKNERSLSRFLADVAKSFDMKVIVSGLGTGDISVEERLEDMGGGEIVSYKKFGDFEDWVLMRRLRQ